jgi:phosphatidylserine/phosphatidylglycerophosphate/cardiolipin synthase-like enzyme
MAMNNGSTKRFLRLTPLFVLLIILGSFLAFQWLEARDRSQTPMIEFDIPQSVEVFFSTPGDPAAFSLRGGPDAALAEAIDRAQYSVDMAIYKLDLWSLRDALLEAHRRGVGVRLVVESANADEAEIETLVSRGIAVREDQRQALMHHKFTIIDGFEVWTGSMNYSVNGAYRNDNNLLQVRSAEIGANYTREFEEMFLEARFGGLSRPDTPYPQSLVMGQRVDVLFSPDDGVQAHLVALVQEAQSSIEILAFSLTSDPLTEALLEAASDGVRVRIVIERDQAGNAGSDAGRLLEAGLDVRLDGNPDSMHHKVIIIDENIVVTGSYNFSRSAEESNDENVIILRISELAADYLVEFNRIYEIAQTDTAGRE